MSPYERFEVSRYICRTLSPIWIDKHERGELDDDAIEEELLPEYETRIAALERPVGRRALEIGFSETARARTGWQSPIHPNAATGFEVHGPDQRRVGDITHIAIGTGLVCPTVIPDAWSRKAVGLQTGPQHRRAPRGGCAEGRNRIPTPAAIMIPRQLPLMVAHDVIGEPTFAGAILGRID